MIFTPMAGGLGDIMTNYLDGELGHFAAAKAAGATTAVKLWCVNPNAADLFAHNPHVDHVLSNPFDEAKGRTHTFRRWAQDGEATFRLMTDGERAATAWERPRFYLSNAEGVIAADIAEAFAPYVALHPFAGRPERRLDRILPAVLDTLAERNVNVVVLGGDSVRRDGGSAGTSFIGECLPPRYESNTRNVYSLVNRFSVRLHAHLASKADKFIGSVSCFNCVAQSSGVPALLFGSRANRSDMSIGASIFGKMRENRTRIHWLDKIQTSEVPNIVREFLK